MAVKTKICRVCGKPYKACNALRKGDSTFRWQEVSCSPECGALYLEEILKSRKSVHIKKSKSTPVNKSSKAKSKQTVAKNTD